ncbi:MAG TPA: winged helix-turn-helix domain-containing protein [Ktedonobacterales bacterium]|nr:winged helix-turn-helix domain-containing protein [Ktedonobacterales bacterium]
MATVAELLRNYIAAISDPTRGAILMELGHAQELTPTQIARRLGMTANNVYHHMRVLREMGVVDPPRAVPRETYVEKYYRVNADLVAAVNSDPEWLDKMQVSLTAADRKALFTGVCMTMAQLLMRAARRYEAMDDDAFDQLVYQRQLGMASINNMRRDKLERRLATLRDMLAKEQADDRAGAEASGASASEAPSAERDTVLMAGLPLFWDDEA